MEVNEFDFAVEIFDQSRATFNPISAVQILHAVNHLHLGAVDVAANDAFGLVTARHGSQSVFVFGDVFHSGLGLGFQIRRERPVAETERAAETVEIKIEVENPVVKVRAELFQQVIEMRQAVRLVAVDDEIFFPGGGGMNHLMRHHHAAETHPGELVHELIMIAGNVDHLRLLAAFAEQFLNEHVVVVAPEPAELQLPAVNKIADDVKILAVHHTQEFQQFPDARVFRAEMDVRNPDRAADNRLVGTQIQNCLVVLHNPMTIRLCAIVNNFGNKYCPS